LVERRDLVAHAGGLLVLFLLGERVHFAFQAFDRLGGVAGEHLEGGVHVAAVVVHRDERSAGRAAEPDLVVDAGARAVREFVVGAVTQAEDAVEGAKGVA
jgi:hypothetical protein